MKIYKKAFGIYETNCYIARTKIGDFIIDPGVDSAQWVKENVKNPLAILNTHGHFDHIWCNAELKAEFNIPIFCPKEDAFMLESDCFNLGLKPQPADILVENNEKILFGSDSTITRNTQDSQITSANSAVCVEYMFFPGHTPGCSMIKIENAIFSGDFIFLRSIGRSDFPYSSNEDMKASLLRFKSLGFDTDMYPGHGENTRISSEQQRIDFWLERL